MPNLTTVNEYNLTSAQSDFTISFDYQKQSYVSVKVEDAALVDVSSNYSGVFTDATTYQFQDSNGDPEQIPSGYRVTFTRDTDISDDLFTFAAGTVIRPDALGESLKTLRDYTEEKNDQTANVTINIANDAITTATTTATTKASEASASATDAASSASAASTSASNAATSETNAGTSETNAAASATAAATSETNAGTSASNAATSETNAATSATNAATSETNAATSATNAATSATNAAASETAAEAARDIVKDVILGQFANDAAVDTYLSGVSYTKDTGDLYFNTTDSRMKVYTGSAWVDIVNTSSSDAAATSASAAQTAQAAAEAALASFNNKWHGEHASDTAVNSAISADSALTLEEGDLYFNSTDNKLKVYNGSAWQNAASVNVINTSTLDTVGDVAAYSGLAQNDFLVRGAGAWENQTPATARASMGLGTSTPTNNDFLKYNSTSGVWEDVDAAAVKTALAISNTDVSGLGTAAVENVGAFATAAQGTTADAAVQPADLATVATSGSYNDLTNLPTLGTAAAAATGDFATATQGGKADTALQPSTSADFGSNRILYSNMWDTSSETLPSASTYHGMFLHDHNTGLGYFAHAGSWQALQNEITTSTALAAASLTTVTDAGNTVDVRRADRIAQGSSTNVDGGATLYDVTATATLTLSDLVAGDIVTVFSRSGTTSVAKGTITNFYIDGDIATNKTSVTVGAGTLATVTMVSDNTAIIAGSDLT